MQFHFGNYALDLDRRELRHGSELVPTGPQVFDLLAYLLQNRERVVSKDDLLEAVWSGRIVSESTLTSHINAARKAVGDSGEEQKLIRTVARKGFRFVGEVTEETPTNAGAKAVQPSPPNDLRPGQTLALPDKPSIAVLPFQNLSGDPEQEYFADGTVEDIITALSRMRWLFVIARNSSFAYKGRAMDVKQVGRELGVRYVVEGGVRKAANRVRITAQLIDATTGVHIWADRFDGPLEDVFELQDQMTESVVGAIAPTLERAEIDRVKHKPTANLDAYDYFLRGMANYHQRTREAINEALPQFYRAIDLDVSFAAAYGMAGWCYVWRKINGWMRDRQQESTEGARLARRAVDLGKDDAVALARGGHALAFFESDFDGGVTFIDRALMLNPNLAAAWYLSGWVRNFRGEPDLAIQHFSRALRLNPLDPETILRTQNGMAFAHFLAARFEDALLWAEKSFRDVPTHVHAASIIAASHALSGRIEVARQVMRRIRELEPALRVSSLKDWIPLRNPDDFAKWSDGLRQAGLPE